MPDLFIKAESIIVRRGKKTVLNNLSFAIGPGQAWAIVGPSGSGKSTLANVIAGRLPVSSGKLTNKLPTESRVVLVEQQHKYRNRTDASATYYQARFDSLNTEEFPTVAEALQESDPTVAPEKIEEVLNLLQIAYLRHIRLIHLSNGENKRFQLVKALLQDPAVLLLDNPFVGLDHTARTALHHIVNQLIQKGMTLILITSPTEVPKRITHVLELHEGRQTYLGPRDSFSKQSSQPVSAQQPKTQLKVETLEAIQATSDPSFKVAIRMHDVTIRYGGRTILDRVSWQVNRGEKWALAGPNGAGKSTLLSLIYGDNPQAYANTIELFDRRKGSGESIWNIKRRIGYVSPELHLYFDRHKTCFKTVASGLTDTMVYNKRLSEEQKAMVVQWLDVFQLAHRQEERLATLPLSEQRRVLLARAMVKNPPVLILDEPCQGLDAAQTQAFKQTVDAICRHVEKTLIYVSHYPEDIPECVNRTLMLKEGRASKVVVNK